MFNLLINKSALKIFEVAGKNEKNIWQNLLGFSDNALGIITLVLQALVIFVGMIFIAINSIKTISTPNKEEKKHALNQICWIVIIVFLLVLVAIPLFKMLVDNYFGQLSF